MWEFLICYFYLIFTVFIWNKCCLFFIDTDTEAKSLKITTGSSIAMFWGSFVWPSSKAWHEASLIDTYLDFTPDPKYIYKKERSRERKTIAFLYLSHQQRRGPFLILSSRHGHFESDKQCKARCSHSSLIMRYEVTGMNLATIQNSGQIYFCSNKQEHPVGSTEPCRGRAMIYQRSLWP